MRAKMITTGARVLFLPTHRLFFPPCRHRHHLRLPQPLRTTSLKIWFIKTLMKISRSKTLVTSFWILSPLLSPSCPPPSYPVPLLLVSPLLDTTPPKVSLLISSKVVLEVTRTLARLPNKTPYPPPVNTLWEPFPDKAVHFY